MDRFRAMSLPAAWPAALALGVAAFAWLSGNGGVFPPDLWDEVAIVAGMRPPESPMPGFWFFGVSRLVRAFGLERTISILSALGPVSLGLVCALMYVFLREMLPLALWKRMVKWGWSRRIVRLVLAQGALCFVLSWPVWNAGRVFSPDMFLLLAGTAALVVFCIAVRKGSAILATPMSILAGLIAADTVFAFALPFAFAAFVKRRLAEPGAAMDDSLRNPLLRYLTFRRMSVAFFLSWMAGVGLNTRWFWASGGLAAQDWTRFSYFVHYLYGYALELGEAAHPIGWALAVLVAAAPLVVSARLVGVATDDGKFLSYFVGLAFLAMGVAAFVQSTGWSSAWFWRWGGSGENVRSQLLLCACLFMTSVTVTLSLCVVGVEFYFRSGGRVAKIRFEDGAEAVSNWSGVVKSLRRAGKAVRHVLACEPAVALALLALPRFSTFERDMASIVNDCAWQTAAECGDAGRLFTDGVMDDAVEVAAARQGRRLKTLSMIAGSTPYEKHVRVRGETDKEDVSMLELGAANALRSWVRDKRERAADIAVQVGFELWRRNGLKTPELGGLVARTAGFPRGERAKNVAAARRLAQRALAMHGRGDPGEAPNVRLADMFSSVEWRIARMCQMRADAADGGGGGDDAMEETELAERLDDCNAAWGRVRERMEWVEMLYDTRLTPREGLTYWLRRGDFTLARMYARQLLRTSPNDSRANFAMGMCYFEEEKYNRAETYLKRSLASRPGEPAALNNLAVVQIRLGRYAEAEANAAKALEGLPDSPEIKRTLDYARKLLAKNGKRAVKRGAAKKKKGRR